MGSRFLIEFRKKKCKINLTLKVKCTILFKEIWRMYTVKMEEPVKNRIQELRKALKVTQSELADAVDVSRQTIISLENNKYNASLMLAHKIARFFGKQIEEIFIFDEEE